jgi:hypothetical protein
MKENKAMSHLFRAQFDCNDISVNVAEMLVADADDEDAWVVKAGRGGADNAPRIHSFLYFTQEATT